MKSFKNFLNESYVGKDGKIYASKGEYEKTVKLLDKTLKTDGVQTKLDLGNTRTSNLPGSGTKVNRGRGRPVGSTTTVKSNIFQQPEFDFKNKTSFTQSVKDGESLSRRMSSAFDKNKNIIPKENQIVNKKVVNNTNKVVDNTNKVVNTNKVDVNKANIVKNKVDDIYNKNINKINKQKIDDIANKNINKLNKQKIDDIYNKNISKLKSQFTNNKKNNVIDIFSRLKNKAGSTFKTGVDKPLNVSNINVNKGPQLPNFVQNRKGPLGSGSYTFKPSKVTDIASRRSRLNQGLSQIYTGDLDKFTSSIDKNVGGKTPNPTSKGKKAFLQFADDAGVILKNPKLVKGVTRATPFINTAIAGFDAKNIYNQSRKLGYSKPKSLARSAVLTTGRVLGGTIGGGIGATKGIVGAIPGSIIGYDIGDRIARKTFDTFGTYKGRRQFGKNFNQFRKDTINKITNFNKSNKGNLK